MEMQKDRLEEFSTLICTAAKSLQRLKNKGMIPFGLGSTHTMCLRKLYESASGATRAELARSCDLDKAQISRIIAELAEKRYITVPETGGKTNYRQKIKLTEEGIAVAEEIYRMALRVNQFVSRDIPEEQLKNFYATFSLICDGLKSAEDAEELL